MKTKNSIMFGITALLAVLILGFASAAITFTNVPSLSTTSSSVNLTVQSTFNETVSFLPVNSINQSSKVITFAAPSNVVLTAGVPQTVIVNYIIPSGFEFRLGQTYSTILSANGTNSSQVNATLAFPKVNNFCSNGDKGDLDLSVDMKNREGYGTEDNEWYPLDNVTVEINVENNGDDTVKNIIVKWGLYNPSTGNWIVDEEESDFDLKHGKDKTFNIIPEIMPDDYDSDTQDYIFYVKAYADDNESNQCISSSEDITVFMDSDFVIAYNPQIDGELTCGGDVQVTADIWNIGTEDEEEVYVTIYNKDLNINEKVVIGDIDSFDKAELDTTITLPSTVKAIKKYYTLEFEVYDSGDDIFQNDNDDESRSTFSINLSDCSAGTTDSGQAQITASLDSDVIAGKEARVLVKVTNLASGLATYSLAATGYSDWASSATFNPTIVALESGKSIEVPLTLAIKDGIAGEQTLQVQVLEGNKQVLTQAVSVEVQKSSNFWSNLFGDNWYLWLIGILNVILVVVIIIVAIRVSRS